MRKFKKTDSKIVMSKNNQNKVLETFISIKFYAECNETTPDIVLYRFHEDYELLTKKDVKKSARGIQHSQVRKRSRTDMESATFETLETTVGISLAILCMSENRRNVTFLQQF